MGTGSEFAFEFYSSGFFGYSDTKDFSYFSLAHFLPIIILAVAIYLVYRYRDKLRNWKGEDSFRMIIAIVMILIEFAYYWRLLYVGTSGKEKQLLTYLPLEVCEWTALIASIMLMKKNKHLFDIAFYIAMTLGVIPLITPAVIEYTGPGYFRYYQFWLEHLLPIFSVFYMIFVHGFKPDWKKAYKPLCFLLVLATFAIIANFNIPNANFMYLAATTDGDSLANILPQNIWLRALVGIGLILVLFTIVSIPQIVSDIKAKRKKANEEQPPQ